MSYVPIPNLPVAVGLDGSEMIEIVQAGTSRRTSIGAVANFPQSGEAFVLATPTEGLTGARQLAAETNVLTITDNGAGLTIVVGVETNGITDAKLRQSAALSVVGNATGSTANVADISAVSGSGAVLRESGGALGFGSITVPGGGTGRATLTDHGVLIGAGTSAITSLAAAAAGTLLAGQGASSDPAFTATPTLGITGSVLGRITFAGNTSGSAILTAQAAAGTPTLSLPTTTGTLVSSSSAPLAINATTGAISVTGAAGQVLAGSTPAFTANPVLGVAGVSQGSLGIAGATSGTVSIGVAAAAGTYNFRLPTSAGSSGQPLLSGGGGASPMTFGTLGVAAGGTGLTSITANNLLIGNGTSAPTLLAPIATSGIPLVSTGAGTAPAYQEASVDGGGTGRTTLTIYNLLVGNGTSAVNFVAPSATSGVPLISQGSSANPAYGTAVVAGGGTGRTTLTAYNLLIGNGTSTVTLVAPSATSGVPLISQGSSADPAYGTAVVAGGGTGAASFTAYAVLCGGTTSTGAFQSVSGLGTSGQVLTSAGAGALPTWTTLAGTGTVTSVATDGILTGGPITASGTLNVNATITPQCRITLTSGVEVMVADVAGATTVYVTPCNGNLVPLYDGTNMVPTVIVEMSQATTDATKSPAAVANDSNYDIFIWDDSGTLRATRGPAWSTSTSRGTGAGSTELVNVNGIWLNAVAITNGPTAERGTYVGTIRSNGTASIDMKFGTAAAGGGEARLCVWNMYNRALACANVRDTTATWTIATSIGALNASNTNRISVIRGFNQDAVFSRLSWRVQATSTQYAIAYIGLDSTSAASTLSTAALPVVSGDGCAMAEFSGFPGLGFHYLQALELASTGVQTGVGDPYTALTAEVWW